MANKNTHWVVRNINGTSKNKCDCKSWITHWRLATHSKRVICAVLECNEKAKVGAHVMVVDGRTSAQWWIVPFCSKHNHYSNTDPMYLKMDVTLISANKQITCQRGEWWENL
jgi:hypothetical protein